MKKKPDPTEPLKLKIDKLRAALQPFANIAREHERNVEIENERVGVRLGDCFKAADTLKETT